MFAYILRRLLQVIPVFFGATLLIYFMVFAMPGDPIAALFGDKPPSPRCSRSCGRSTTSTSRSSCSTSTTSWASSRGTWE